ncbi:hypothetical protein [Amphritea pacifica]|uniref:Uncharacterized protein n=1 Tax=Amphritea pacifica TaxID=2811233 RepID=A0ABS2WAA7_9GAMM|nr:hypothetical protein [Amphritea pacifica]MBN0988422.1 hypothetical protein [Amphritea pacifica]MBN1006678.1 hypothetical protein [Amphritea pacifica]
MSEQETTSTRIMRWTLTGLLGLAVIIGLLTFFIDNPDTQSGDAEPVSQESNPFQ